jgi:pyruvate dehydrogenase E2 component (dihydrolipoamide acetyltransferase)
MSVEVFTLPDLGEGLAEAQLVRWLVAVGDRIDVDAPVAEVETAKAVVEVPSPYAGVITVRHGDEGSVIPVGAPLISLRPEAEHGAVFAGRVVDTAARSRPKVASPLVRRMLRQRGLDAAAIVGSGPDGLVTRADVERLDPATDHRTGLPIGAVTPLRAATAEVLSRSRREIPEATVWVDVDATELVRLREELGRHGDKPSLLAMIARFTVAGLAGFPELNSRVDSAESRIVQFSDVNLGIATQTDDGLVVPSVANAQRLSIAELDTEIRGITAAARERTATPAGLGRGSFTLNNYGVFGVDGSAAIINHPEVAILGIGRIMPRPWVVDGELAPREITQLSLVFDHRVCDGRTAAGFLRFVADAIERPLSLYTRL